MIRKKPSGHLPQIHESAYVDQTAILCGKVIVHENELVQGYKRLKTNFNRCQLINMEHAT